MFSENSSLSLHISFMKTKTLRAFPRPSNIYNRLWLVIDNITRIVIHSFKRINIVYYTYKESSITQVLHSYSRLKKSSAILYWRRKINPQHVFFFFFKFVKYLKPFNSISNIGFFFFFSWQLMTIHKNFGRTSFWN